MAEHFPTSAIVYQGPSMFDGAPIVAIVTGLLGDSANDKTGPMAQLWIMRSDMSPLESIDRRLDSSVCASCKHRGFIDLPDPTEEVKRSCYVNMRTPMSVYHAFARGSYPVLDPIVVAQWLHSQGRTIRLGAWGEPTALPLSTVRALITGVTHTGYTHEWPRTPAFADTVMASVDSVDEAEAAIAAGWRYFRTRRPGDPLLPGEIACPASEEAGKRTTCEKCKLCDGKRGETDRRKNVAIYVHGSGKVHALKFISTRSAA